MPVVFIVSAFLPQQYVEPLNENDLQDDRIFETAGEVEVEYENTAEQTHKSDEKTGDQSSPSDGQEQKAEERSTEGNECQEVCQRKRKAMMQCSNCLLNKPCCMLEQTKMIQTSTFLLLMFVSFVEFCCCQDITLFLKNHTTSQTNQTWVSQSCQKLWVQSVSRQTSGIFM